MSNSNTFDDLPLRPSDFESIRLFFDLVNTTTGAELHRDATIKLVQLLEGGMLLELPTRSCSQGHSLSLQLSLKNIVATGDLEFQATVKVESMEKSPRGELVTVTLVQYDKKAWTCLNEIFNSRQKEILEFMTGAKGF